jgi:DNA-binding CsgD family transcriptional regulator
MRLSAVLQHIQHIASIGLADVVAIPEMLATLELAVPAAYASFFWITRDGLPTRTHTPSSVLDQMARHTAGFEALDPALEPTLDKVLAVGGTVGNLGKMARRHDLSRSALIHEVMPRLGAAMGLDMVIRADGAPRAVLYLNREVGARDFSAAEQRVLAATHAYFAHALGAPAGEPGAAPDPEAEAEAILTVDRAGGIIAAAGAWPVILSDLARLEPGDAGTGRLPPVLRPLLDRQRMQAAGCLTTPARLTIATPHGEYRARAYLSHGEGGGGADQITVIVAHHLPRAVGMLRRLAALPLSPTERRVAFAVGRGEPNARVADSLGLTPQTLRSYLKSIYARTETDGWASLAALVRGER